MEKFLEAARLAWNPLGEVRRRLNAGTLSVPDVLIPVVAAVIACNLVRMAASDFFWNTAIHAADSKSEKLETPDFVIQFASALGILVTVASLMLLPARAFQPRSRTAVAAALLIVVAASSFYSAAIEAPLYFVEGSLAFQSLQMASSTFDLLNAPLALGVLGLTVFFWCRIALAQLTLRVGQVVSITIVVALGYAAIVGLGLLISFAAS